MSTRMMIMMTCQNNLEEIINITNIPKYSFSSLSAFNTCPKMYYDTYIKEINLNVDNDLARFGTYSHNKIEDMFQNNKFADEVIDTIKEDFLEYFPEGIKINIGMKELDLTAKYYSALLEYLENTDYLNDLEIVSVEKELRLLFYHNGKPRIFKGFIDILAKNKKGEYIIIDLKSKSAFKSEKEKREYYRQLYLYSSFIEAEYGVFPKELWFEQFKIQTRIKEKFQEQYYNESWEWVHNTIDKIENEIDFDKNLDSFFCNNLCNHRYTCI